MGIMTRQMKQLACRILSGFFLFTTGTLLYGQASGFNFSLGYGSAVVRNPMGSSIPSTVIGLAFQHDFDQRFGVALDFFLDGDEDSYINSFDWVYSAKYFFSDNDETAFYLGSFIGYQHLMGTESIYSGMNSSAYGTYTDVKVSKVQFPIGIRAGVRGGMAGYFAELFAQAGYAIGNGKLYYSEGQRVSSSPLYFTLGVSFLGFGWDHARSH